MLPAPQRHQKENPMPRYLTSDGQIDWQFITDMRLGLIPDKTPEEQEVLAVYFTGHRVAVIRYLAESGDIVIEGDTDGFDAYGDYLEDRRRQRSANGRGRRTRW